MDKIINGKAIYSPKGKAGEYAKYACNFYVGCDNNCSYCYCKRGVLGHAMGAPKATLKKCFKDENDAFRTFRNEVKANADILRKHGLFFSFTSDPMLTDERRLTIDAVDYATNLNIPCKILTKRADFLNIIPAFWLISDWKIQRIAFGFTLTGHDEKEPGASTNAERIEAMKMLHDIGFKTFASIEPIITLENAATMIGKSIPYCDLYLIGLLSGKKEYTPNQVKIFINTIYASIKYIELGLYCAIAGKLINPKFYIKDSVFEYTGIKREDYKNANDVFVPKDYNLFNNLNNNTL